MNDIVEKVDSILKKDKSLSNEFGEFSKVYLMTTENIKGYLEKWFLEDKDVLTVAGSGDQMLNAYLLGAKNVTCFDINPLAFCQVKLKKAAVCTLNYEEYLEFFLSNPADIFRRDYFDKIASELDKETLELFNYLYSNYSNKEIFKKIYYRFPPNIDNMKRLNSYLERENYEKLASILRDKEITFIHSDVTSLRDNLHDKYDFILLSNINDSIGNIWENEPLKNYKRLIHSLSKKLNNYGIIQVGYIYDYYINRQNYIVLL